MTRLNPIHIEFGVMQFKGQTALIGLRISTLEYLIRRTPNTNGTLPRGYRGGPSRWSCCPRLLLLLMGSKFLVMSSTGQTLLMIFTLRVSQVVGFVAVQRETQLRS
jgi:hypothetical protein